MSIIASSSKYVKVTLEKETTTYKGLLQNKMKYLLSKFHLSQSNQ